MVKPREKRVSEKSRNWSKTAMGIFIILIMVASSVGYVFFYRNPESNAESSIEYNGLKFIPQAGGWQLLNAYGTSLLTHLPKDVLSIECQCEGLTAENLRAQKIYFIALSNEEKRAAQEFIANLPLYASIQAACLPEQESREECIDLPLKYCNDVSQGVRVAIFTESYKTGVKFNNGCLIIEGNASSGLIKASDRAFYEALGIIKTEDLVSK